MDEMYQNLDQYNTVKPQNKSQKGNQFRALFLKSLTIQGKQKGTNCCQIVTPLICLLLVLLIQEVAKTQIGPENQTQFQLPIVSNIPTLYQIYNVYPQSPIKTTNCLQWNLYGFSKDASNETRNYVENNIVNNVNQFECTYKNGHDQNITQMVPYYVKTEDDINQRLYSDLLELNQQPFIIRKDINGNEILPDGTLYFYDANDTKINLKLQINDERIYEYHRLNGVTKLGFATPNSTKIAQTLIATQGQLALLGLVSRAQLNKLDNSQEIVTGTLYMPSASSDQNTIIDGIINLSGASLYPLSLSLLLPIFMYQMVLEKEERLIEMMKMNGLKIINYWYVNYIFFFMMYLVTATIFILFGCLILQLSFFTETSGSLLFFLLLGWGLYQVSLSIFLQVFIQKAKTSSIVGYVVSIWVILIAISFNIVVFPTPQIMPWYLLMVPQFGFTRIVYILSVNCSSNNCIKDLSDLPSEVNTSLVFMYFFAIVFFLLGIYLNEIISQQFGIKKKWNYCLKRNQNIRTSVIQRANDGIQINEDQDSQQEREKVQNMNDDQISQFALVVKNLKKLYPPAGGRPAHLAVVDFCLSIKKGEIFGLLGPNGAGKTSLISMITGLYTPESGNAWVDGQDILNNLEQVQLQIGVCPQFDLLWSDLTVEEHLYFYARIKGIQKQDENIVVDQAIENVQLQSFKEFRISQLSGGMKRRVSLAISLVGQPSVIFLDEPTTGLDPENRRGIWDILQSCRKDRAVILTTHSMEEADVLSNRIGIITDGQLRCIGQQQRLKNLYGGGYHLYINAHKKKYLTENVKEFKNIDNFYSEKLEDIQNNIKSFVGNIVQDSQLISQFNGNFIFLLPMEGLKISLVFDQMEKNKNRLLISDWGVSQSSLEDVFLRIVDN